MTKVEIAAMLRKIANDLDAIKLPHNPDDIVLQKLEEVQVQLAAIKKELESVPPAVQKEYEEFLTFVLTSPESGIKKLIDEWNNHVKGKSFTDGLFRWMIQLSVDYLRKVITLSIDGLRTLAEQIEK